MMTMNRAIRLLLMIVMIGAVVMMIAVDVDTVEKEVKRKGEDDTKMIRKGVVRSIIEDEKEKDDDLIMALITMTIRHRLHETEDVEDTKRNAALAAAAIGIGVAIAKMKTTAAVGAVKTSGLT